MISDYISLSDNILAIATFNQTILYDVINDVIINTFNIGGPICLTKELLIGHNDDHIVILDLRTREIIWKIEIDDLSVISVYENILIFAGDDITIFSLNTWKVLKILKGHTLGVSSFIVNNDILISGSIDNTIKF